MLTVKVKYHPREGYMEVEGEPVELAHYTSEIMRRLGHGLELKSAVATDQSIIGTNPIAKTPEPKAKRIRTKEVIEYLYSKGTPDMTHTMRELAEHFFGAQLDSKDKSSPYNRFYNRVVDAHKVIASERNGVWDGEWEFDRDGRYRVYKFIQK